MEYQPISIKALGIKYGLIAAAAFILVFLMARAFNINDPVFRFVNYIILGIAIALALNEERKHIHKHRLNYLPGLGIGIYTTVVTAVVYAVFMFIYCNFLNPRFIPEIREHLPFQDYINGAMLSFVAFGETMVFGAIASFVIMQFFKRNRDGDHELEEEAAERDDNKIGKNPNVQ